MANPVDIHLKATDRSADGLAPACATGALSFTGANAIVAHRGGMTADETRALVARYVR